MDPAIANQDFDPPAEPPLVRRALLPALAVNAVFIAALAWSVPWHRGASSDAASTSPADQRSMGGPPAAMEPAAPPVPASPVAMVTPQRLPAPAQAPQVQVAPVVPQPGSPYPPAQDPPAARSAPQRPPVVASVTPADRTSPGPSFDCAKARSRSEKLICADPELAQLDRELGRLNVRARALSPDPVAFRRAGDVQWKRRETECSDKACLLAWYAERRAQLQEAVARGEKTAGR